MFDSPEEKAALQSAIDDAIEGMQSKNTELLREVKQLKRGKDIDPSDVTKLEEQIDGLKAELQTSTKANKESEKTVKKLTEDLGSEQEFTKKLLIDNGLTAELTANGVTNPAHLSGARALLRDGLDVVADGKDRVARAGEKSIVDYVKEWSDSDIGKNYVAADQTTGGGSGGDGDKPTPTDLSKMTATQKMDAGRAKAA
tara:strand:+ start:16173 stop:16769 length:597 start_codon:yes stop_codon:yes gene_type:complete